MLLRLEMKRHYHTIYLTGIRHRTGIQHHSEIVGGNVGVYAQQISA